MILNDFLLLSNDDMIASLEPYQQELVKSLISYTDGDYNKAADFWLSASPSNTYKFGGESNRSSIFREKVLDELEKFICGCDEGKYDSDREELSKRGDLTKEIIISFLSASIGSTIGVAGAFVAPVIVLLLLDSGKIAKNAWCEMMKEKKTQKSR